MKSSRQEAEVALSKAASDMKRYADQSRKEKPTYKVGQKVWLEASNFSTDRPSKKLSHGRLGPCPIVEIVNPNTVKLRLPRQLRIHPVFNVSDVRPFNESTIPGQKSKTPEPVFVNEETRYEVEEILNSRLSRGKLQFLIKWKGYTDEHNSWQPESNVLPGAEKLVKKYYVAHPNAPRRINATSFAKLIFRPFENFTEPSSPSSFEFRRSFSVHPRVKLPKCPESVP